MASDHDQRFKILIQSFFPEFLALFFPQWAERLDARAVEWLMQEVFPDPPQGPRRVLDLAGKMPTRQVVPGQRPGEPNHWLALLHLEIESPDKSTLIKPRLFHSFVHLRDKYELPVLPIALYLHVGLEGVGVDVYVERFWELEVVRFQYLYVGLPALDAIEYVQGDNCLGWALAALMRKRQDQAALVGGEGLRRIAAAPLTDQQRFLLAECMQAYLTLNDEQQREFEELVAGEPYEGVRAMNKTWYEKGLEQGTAMNQTWFEKGEEKGMAKGEEQERRRLLRVLLEERFGTLPASAQQRLVEWPADRLAAVERTILRAQSLREIGLED
jgi:hypothetical protein